MTSLRAKVMAKAPALVLSAVTAASGYAIYYAHHQQVVDKEVRGFDRVWLLVYLDHPERLTLVVMPLATESDGRPCATA